MADKPKINLANYQVGKIIGAKMAKLVAEETKPPAYYTESSLLEDMTACWKFASNDKERAMLKETMGIGTARTRGQVIADLLRKQQMERVGKGKKQVLKDTPFGRFLTKIAPPAMTSVVMTAQWEMMLSMVAKGQITADQFREKMHAFCAGLVMFAKSQSETAAANAAKTAPQKTQSKK